MNSRIVYSTDFVGIENDVSYYKLSQRQRKDIGSLLIGLQHRWKGEP